MTEYWVSQGNKWCDFCKIYISNNPLSIRTHELGQRHKDSVAKRLTNMRKEKAEKEKEEKDAARALQQIEAVKKDSFQIDEGSGHGRFATDFRRRGGEGDSGGEEAPRQRGARVWDTWQLEDHSDYHNNSAHYIHIDMKLGVHKSIILFNSVIPLEQAIAEWKYDSGSAYYYNQASGKWVKYEDIANHSSSGSKQKGKGSGSGSGLVAEDSSASKYHRGPPPGLVVKESVNPMRAVKGAPSSIALNNKRKRDDEKKQAKVVSKEEADALKAREAAKKRVEEREKMLLGLYKSY
ncbi:hypothetical protein Scep_001964 [Stephania cephalantha]|uniref:Matrin-type domain-containing protein n=1 Tax=Stephania cephalantha TaxID=152367 RepID=A0AAP0LAE0_9MAGN